MSARTVRVGDLDLDIAVNGPLDGRPVVLLLAGLGRQRTEWPDTLLQLLRAAGLTVVTYDHRDAGRSSALDHLPGDADDVARWQRGEPFAVPYRLRDLAADAVGILDALAVDRAHLVGHSMGGMVAQHLVVDRPARVASLTLISTTTGAADVGAPSEATIEAMGTPTPHDREAYVAASLARARLTHGPLLDEGREADRVAAAYDRAFRPAGRTRQLLAILADPDRTAALAAVDVPTLVVHGPHDGMVDVSGGRAVAAAIPDATYLEVPQMGHDLPEPLLPELARALVATARGAS